MNFATDGDHAVHLPYVLSRSRLINRKARTRVVMVLLCTLWSDSATLYTCHPDAAWKLEQIGLGDEVTNCIPLSIWFPKIKSPKIGHQIRYDP